MPDIGLEEKFMQQNQYSAQAIYRWNINGQSGYIILDILQQVIMIVIAQDQAIIVTLISYFTSQLKGWRNILLIDEKKHQIVDTIKTNHKCKYLQDFKWYKDGFLTKEDCNQPFEKKFFLVGLFSVFSEKTKLKN